MLRWNQTCFYGGKTWTSARIANSIFNQISFGCGVCERTISTHFTTSRVTGLIKGTIEELAGLKKDLRHSFVVRRTTVVNWNCLELPVLALMITFNYQTELLCQNIFTLLKLD
jgi:hypothetical protein